MDRPSRKGSCTLVPPDEHKCVWMSAGILAYQLCERSFDCENCPLDRALRHAQNEADRSAGTPAARGDGAPAPLRDGFLYAPNHCWLRPLGGRRVRVGIEPGLAAALLTPKAVVPPSRGDKVRKNHVCLWVVTEGGTFPLASPVDGDVLAVNDIIRDRPRAMFLDPLGEGWIYEASVNTHTLHGTATMRRKEASGVYAEATKRLRMALREALETPGRTVGQTMADGGLPLVSASDILGAKRYFQILRAAYR